MPGGIDFTLAGLPGTAGAALAVGVTYLIAARWKRRCGVSYCVSAFVFYAVFYTAALEYGILEAIRLGKSVPADMRDVLLLGHSAITAAGVAIFTLLVFGLFVGLRAPAQDNRDPMRAYCGCAAFCLIIVAFLNPVGVVARIHGLSTAPLRMAAFVPAREAPGTGESARPAKQRADRTPEPFPAPGLVRRVEIRDGRIIHYVSGKFRTRAGVSFETYARMVLAHRLYFDNGRPGAVVIRSARTGRHVATRHPDGRFRSQLASRRARK